MKLHDLIKANSKVEAITPAEEEEVELDDIEDPKEDDFDDALDLLREARELLGQLAEPEMKYLSHYMHKEIERVATELDEFMSDYEVDDTDIGVHP
jgi:hypothetical protein